MVANVPGSLAATGHQPGSPAATCPQSGHSPPALAPEDTATGHQPGSPAAMCPQSGSPAATCPPRASDFQPDDTDVHEALRLSAFEAALAAEAAADDGSDLRRARAVAECGAAVAELAFRTRAVPQFIKDFGGYSAPVVVTGLEVGDVFPNTLRYTKPSARRVEEELHKLVRALPGERARLLVKMCYWPKLLDAVATQEKKDEQSERARLRRQSDKQCVILAPGCFEPEDAATSPYEAVVEAVATSPDVGGNKAEEKRPELRRTKRVRLSSKQQLTGSASASSAAAASSAPSASCAAAATDSLSEGSAEDSE